MDDLFNFKMRFSLTLIVQFSTAVLASLISLEDSLFSLNFEQIDVFQLRLQVPMMSQPPPAPAPLYGSDGDAGVASWRFIVTLKEELTTKEVSNFKSEFLLNYTKFAAKMRIEAAKPEFFSIHAFNAFVAFLSPSLLDEVRSDPRVLMVENEATNYLADSLHPLNSQSPPRTLQTQKNFHTLDIQKHSAWGLDRISHRDNSGVGPKQYLHDPQGGAGVNVYVIDSGIDVDHPQFEGRARWGTTTTSPHVQYDFDGHGTHVAGIIGSRTYGVSKKVNLIAVGAVCPWGNTPDGDFIKGIEWAVADHEEHVNAREEGFKGLVINLSVGRRRNRAVDRAVQAAIDAGMHVSIASGNVATDARHFSPFAPDAIVVGSIEQDDFIDPDSNWGLCVSVFAPGIDIESTSTWGESTLMSGTLMAAGYVSGLLAYFLSLAPAGVNVDPPNLKRRLLRFATRDMVEGLGDSESPNLIIFNGAGGDLAEFWQD